MSNNLKQGFTESYIPAVKRMIAKEEKHLKRMKKVAEDHPHIYQSHQFVASSERDLKHYRQRLQEYKEYAEGL